MAPYGIASACGAASRSGDRTMRWRGSRGTDAGRGRAGEMPGVLAEAEAEAEAAATDRWRRDRGDWNPSFVSASADADEEADSVDEGTGTKVCGKSE